MRLFKTVLGDISESDLGATLVHEHICCYSEYAYRMAGKDYLDKDALADTATVYLKELKKNLMVIRMDMQMKFGKCRGISRALRIKALKYRRRSHVTRI